VTELEYSIYKSINKFFYFLIIKNKMSNLQDDINNTLLEKMRTRPKNTSKTYNARRSEFIKWMEDSNFPDSITVTAEKIHSFMKHNVINRMSKTNSNVRIGYSTIRAYCSACIDLYKEQRSLNMNSNPHPKDHPALAALLESSRANENQKRRENFEDRGSGTIQDGYSTIRDLEQISDHFLSKNSTASLKYRAMFLLTHFCLLRGESVRRLDLADMFLLELENEGYTDCKALTIIMDQGKTNQFGKKELGSCIRNKLVGICPLGAVGLYFFSRWHINNEPPPNFSRNSEWFNYKFAPGRRGPECEISYQSHLDSMKSCLKELNISSSAKTHLGRGAGARMAELAGATEDDIRRLGRWNSQALAGCYLTSLPRGGLRTLAGFAPEGGTYYLKRCGETPPVELQKMIFPWLESVIEDEENEKSLAFKGFTGLLIYLRTVILQDIAVLSDKFPDHPVMKHEIVCSPEFLIFKQTLLHVIHEQEDPVINNFGQRCHSS
jgi:hypothetical protein